MAVRPLACEEVVACGYSDTVREWSYQGARVVRERMGQSAQERTQRGSHTAHAVVMREVTREVACETDASSLRLLDRIDLRILRGELLHVVGPSGAGKSTLLRLVNRLDEPSAGSLEVLGRRILDWPVRELRRSVGMVFQEPRLLGLSVRENLNLAVRLGANETPNAEQRIEVAMRLECRYRAAELAKLDLGLLGRDESQLSVGEKQRVALARTLISEPDYGRWLVGQFPQERCRRSNQGRGLVKGPNLVARLNNVEHVGAEQSAREDESDDRALPQTFEESPKHQRSQQEHQDVEELAPDVHHAPALTKVIHHRQSHSSRRIAVPRPSWHGGRFRQARGESQTLYSCDRRRCSASSSTNWEMSGAAPAVIHS